MHGLGIETPDAVLGEELLALRWLEPHPGSRCQRELEQAHTQGSSADGDRRSSAA